MRLPVSSWMKFFAALGWKSRKDGSADADGFALSRWSRESL